MIIDINGTKWRIAIDAFSQHTITSPKGNEVLAYKAVITEVVKE